MKILRLTSADFTRDDRSVWVNFDLVKYVEGHYKGARIHFTDDTTVLVEESAEDIMMAFSAMDNKPYDKYNVGIALLCAKAGDSK